MNPAALIPIVSELIDFFRDRRFVKKNVIPLVTSADGLTTLPDNEARRAFVVAQLRSRYGLSESDANRLTELGVTLWKKFQARLAKRAAKKAAHS